MSTLSTVLLAVVSSLDTENGAAVLAPVLAAIENVQYLLSRIRAHIVTETLTSKTA